MGHMSEVLQVLLIREDDGWSAQCLQYDIGAEAKTLRDVLYEFERAVIGHLAICSEKQLTPFAVLGPAPEAYWREWQTACRLEAQELPAFRAIPGTTVGSVRKDVRIAA